VITNVNLNDKIERRAKKLASNFTQTVAAHLVNSRRRWMKVKESAGTAITLSQQNVTASCFQIVLRFQGFQD
jgi:hypothetical protein